MNILALCYSLPSLSSIAIGHSGSRWSLVIIGKVINSLTLLKSENIFGSSRKMLTKITFNLES